MGKRQYYHNISKLQCCGVSNVFAFSFCHSSTRRKMVMQRYVIVFGGTVLLNFVLCLQTVFYYKATGRALCMSDFVALLIFCE